MKDGREVNLAIKRSERKMEYETLMIPMILFSY